MLNTLQLCGIEHTYFREAKSLAAAEAQMEPLKGQRRCHKASASLLCQSAIPPRTGFAHFLYGKYDFICSVQRCTNFLSDTYILLVPYRISVCHSVQGFWRRVQASGKSYKIYGLRNVQSEGVVMSSSMLRVATKHVIITGRITSNNMFARGRQNNSKPVSLLRKECDTVKQ